MSWARLDDGFHAHPRTLQAGLEANGLFCRAISYCAQFLTDGFVPGEWLEQQGGPVAAKRAIKRNIEAGLIERIEGGYMIVGYLERNPSRADVHARRRADSERKRIGFRPDSDGNPNGHGADS